LQFGPSEDLARYPRTLDADAAIAQRAGVDLLWAPAVEDVYPNGSPAVTVHPGPLGDELEGAVRPGHFAGVLTVVSKFFHLIRPDRAYFGEKDYQQLVLIRRMVADLDLPVEVVGVPTVREQDGLALSSRNTYLSAEDRLLALTLSRALRTGSLEAATAEFAAHPEIVLDYVALRTSDLGPVPPGRPERLLVAARVGSTRLIDNMAVRP
jgi:pantoate--beta-alanine ligase